jgi:hypothetical protein
MTPTTKSRITRKNPREVRFNGTLRNKERPGRYTVQDIEGRFTFSPKVVRLRLGFQDVMITPETAEVLGNQLFVLAAKARDS